MWCFAGALVALASSPARADEPLPPELPEADRGELGALSSNTEPVELEIRRATTDVHVRARPSAYAPRRAIIAEGASFFARNGEFEDGKGCDAGWLAVPSGGYVCSAHTEPSTAPPIDLPDPVYGDLPFLYAFRPGHEAFNYAFLRAEEEDGERYLVRLSGSRRSAEGLELRAPSPLRGRDLTLRPVPPGLAPAFTADEVPVYPAPGTTASDRRLTKHAALVVRVREAEEGVDETWLELVEAPGGARGWVRAEDGVRHWVDHPPPDDLRPGERWADIDIEQQMLAVREGARLLYVTLISGGTYDRPTPLGTFAVRDKRSYTTMASGPSSPDRYRVEAVPWTLYFWPHYAIHAAYWHDEFGRPRSHGCVNLAPKDAAWVFANLGPRHDPGYFRSFATEDEPGSTVRVRKGNLVGRDRRE